jgi:hypothetical protein
VTVSVMFLEFQLTSQSDLQWEAKLNLYLKTCSLVSKEDPFLYIRLLNNLNSP